MNRDLIVYTICFNPSDFPGKFTCRRASIVPGGPALDHDFLMVEDSIEPIRAKLTRLGLYRQPRYDDDDPVIVECWF